MFTSPGLTLGDQIFWIVDLFLKILGPEVGKLRIGAISLVIWNRMRKFERQFLALYARWKAGTLPKARLRSSAVKGFNRGERGEAQREGAPANLLPRGRGWLYKMLPRSAGTLAGRLGSLLLEHPEMKVFAAEVPQVGRLLRPICRMVWMQVPEYLALPKRKRRTGECGLRRGPRARKEDTPRRSLPQSGEGDAVAPPAGSLLAEMIEMRRRTAEWAVGRPEPPCLLLPLGFTSAQALPDPALIPLYPNRGGQA